MRSDSPIPNLSTVETPMTEIMDVREITTLNHVSSLVDIWEIALGYRMNVGIRTGEEF